MPSKKDLLLIAAVLVSGTLLVERVLAGGQEGGGGDANRDLIAVTGTIGTGAAALYLVDTETRQLAVYRLESGRGLEFVAARNCTYDFYLQSYSDRSPPQFSPDNLRRQYERFLRRGGSTGSRDGDEGEAEEGSGSVGESGVRTGPDVRPVEPGSSGGGDGDR